MAINKVVYNTEDGERILIDLTSDTVTPETLAKGVTAHDASGEKIVGTMLGGTGGNQLDATLNGTLTEIDSEVTKVIGYACRGITTLASVKLPNATSIATYAFYGCSGIKSLISPKVSSLGTYSFYGCSALTEVNFPMATSVPSSAFYLCENLTKADFGRASSIGGYGFYSCSKLGTLILRKTDGVVSIQSTSLTSTKIANKTGYVYVPSALVEAYKEDSGWSAYSRRIRAIEDYPDICG